MPLSATACARLRSLPCHRWKLDWFTKTRMFSDTRHNPGKSKGHKIALPLFGVCSIIWTPQENIVVTEFCLLLFRATSMLPALRSIVIWTLLHMFKLLNEIKLWPVRWLWLLQVAGTQAIGLFVPLFWSTITPRMWTQSQVFALLHIYDSSSRSCSDMLNAALPQ